MLKLTGTGGITAMTKRRIANFPTMLVTVLGLAAGCAKFQEPLDGEPDARGDRDTQAEVIPEERVDAIPVDLVQSVDTRIVCTMPSYPSDCSQVRYFQCGFSGKCVAGTIAISWHEHECGNGSGVTNYTCVYTCPKGCKTETPPWSSSGTEIVQATCNP